MFAILTTWMLLRGNRLITQSILQFRYDTPNRMFGRKLLPDVYLNPMCSNARRLIILNARICSFIELMRTLSGSDGHLNVCSREEEAYKARSFLASESISMMLRQHTG